MIAVRRTLILTAGLLGLLAVSVYGFWSRGLWREPIWQPPGPERFLIFLAVCAVWFGGWIAFRPAWMLPATLLFCAVYTAFAVGVLPIIAVAVFLFACLVCGRLLLRSADDLPLPLLVGLGVAMWVVGILVHFPANYAATYAAMAAGVLLLRPSLSRTSLQQVLRAVGPRPWKTRSESVMLAVALVPLLAHWLVALKPEVGADALSMHMVVPAFIANHHWWSFDFRQYAWAVMPMGGVWCYTVTYLWGGEFAARLLNFALLTVICALLYTSARRWVDRRVALLISGLFASTPIVQLVTGSLMVETFYAVLILGGVVAVWQYHDTRQPPILVAAAFLLGSAMAVKLMALPFVVVVSLVAAWPLVQLWRSGERRWPAIAAAVFAVAAAPPYAYAWVTTGNPVFPFVNNFFRSPFFPAVSSPDNRFLEPLTWRTLFDMTFATRRYWEGQDGSFGFQFLLLLPLVAPAMRPKWGFVEWTLIGISTTATTLAFLTRANLRYLYPGWCLLTLAVVLLFQDRLFRRIAWPAALACLAMNLWFLPSSSFYHKTFCLNPLERDAAAHYLAEAAPVRLLVDRLNRDHAGESALFLDTGDVAGLRGDFYSDGWHCYRFMQQVKAQATPADLLRMLQSLGLRHFVFPNPAAGVPIREAQIRWVVENLSEKESDCGGFRLASLRPNADPASVPPPAPAPPGTYDDFDPRIRFYADWSHDPQFGAAANHSLTYSDAAVASFRFVFRGSEVTWVYTKAANRGIAEIRMDQASRGEVDLYSPQTAWQSRSTFGGLADGVHELEIRSSGRKNPRASGNYVDLDELVVR